MFYIIFSSPIDLIRIIYGPLGLEVCEINRMMKIMIPLIIIFLCNAIAFWKFIFICVWKSYRTINDSFLTFFTIISATFVTFLLGLSVVSGPGKPPMYKIVCTGVFKNSDNLLGPKFIGIDIAQSTGFLAYIGFLLPVWISKRKIKTEEKINVFHQRPKELVNHSTNIFALVMIGSASFANFKINM